MMAVPMKLSAGVEPGRPAHLFEDSYYDNVAPNRSYDVTPDGRFLMITEPAGNELPQEI